MSAAPVGHNPGMSAAAQTPLHVAPPVDDGLALRFYTVTSGDGTRLQAWTNDVDGPTVLLCNGLGTNPYSWPALLDPDCGVRSSPGTTAAPAAPSAPPTRSTSGSTRSPRTPSP